MRIHEVCVCMPQVCIRMPQVCVCIHKACARIHEVCIASLKYVYTYIKNAHTYTPRNTVLKQVTNNNQTKPSMLIINLSNSSFKIWSDTTNQKKKKNQIIFLNINNK